MFKLTIETDNAAFTDESARDEDRNDDDARAQETARILRQIAARVAEGYTEGFATDGNGNRVGRYEFSDK